MAAARRRLWQGIAKAWNALPYAFRSELHERHHDLGMLSARAGSKAAAIELDAIRAANPVLMNLPRWVVFDGATAELRGKED